MAEATVASILQREAVLPETRSLFARHASWWPDAEQPRDFSREENIVQFQVQDADGTLVLSDFRHPDLVIAERKGLLEGSPGLLKITREHKAFVMVMLGTEHLNALERATCLTRWVASIAEACEALGVFWGESGVLTPRKEFCEMARAMDEELLPLPLWISFALELHKDGSHSLQTCGMREFGFWEIEIHREAVNKVDLFNYAAGFAQYLFNKHPEISDGDTFGSSEEDRSIRIRHGTASDESGPAYLLEFGRRPQ